MKITVISAIFLHKDTHYNTEIHMSRCVNCNAVIEEEENVVIIKMIELSYVHVMISKLGPFTQTGLFHIFYDNKLSTSS